MALAVRRSLLSRLAIGALVVACSARAARAAEPATAAEDQIKAAFLYKFAGYVDWPPESFEPADGRFTIAVVGADRLVRELRQTVEERTVHERPVEVRRLRADEPLAGVHMLFVGADEHERLEELVRESQREAILVVTESAGSLEAGSVINFVVADQRVRFEISIESAEKSRLKLSSRLLAVARRVIPGDG